MKKNKKQIAKKEISEFKKFIMRGNILELSVGVIIGSAFGKIVTSLVDNILMPIIGIFLGGLDFTNLSFKIGDAKVTYGVFIQSVVDFLIISVCIFVFLKIISKAFNNFNHHKEKETKKSDEILLLEEIRDLLKERV